MLRWNGPEYPGDNVPFISESLRQAEMYQGFLWKEFCIVLWLLKAYFLVQVKDESKNRERVEAGSRNRKEAELRDRI